MKVGWAVGGDDWSSCRFETFAVKVLSDLESTYLLVEMIIMPLRCCLAVLRSKYVFNA